MILQIFYRILCFIYPIADQLLWKMLNFGSNAACSLQSNHLLKMGSKQISETCL